MQMFQILLLLLAVNLSNATPLFATNEAEEAEEQSDPGPPIPLNRFLRGHGFYPPEFVDDACRSLLARNSEQVDHSAHEGQIELAGKGAGRTTIVPGLYGHKWIKFAIEAGLQGHWTLEVGAAIGTTTLPALEQGAKVYALDRVAENLAVIQSRVTTQQAANLRLVRGRFPSALRAVPDNFLASIFIGSVLHLMTPEEIPDAVEFAARKLRTGGLLIIENQTPFMPAAEANYQHYLESLEARDPFPGFIPNVRRVFPARREFRHLTLFDLDTTQSVLRGAGLDAPDDLTRYFPRHSFPDILAVRRPMEVGNEARYLIDAQVGTRKRRYESVGGIGIKPLNWKPRAEREKVGR